jgi:predicted transcriptional regulator of viral defense system
MYDLDEAGERLCFWVNDGHKNVATTNDFCHNAVMRWQQLQHIVQGQPLFETSLLLTGDVTHHQAQRQLSDWVEAQKVVQLRRGLYTLPNHNPHPFVVANHLVSGSYVSLQMALGYYHLIPEHVAVITSVTTQRPGNYENKFGRFSYRHIHPSLFFGIEFRLLANEECAYVAMPEKALLDLIHFRPQGDSREYIESLRLQNLEILNIDRLHRLAEQADRPKLKRAASVIEAIARRQAEEYEPL